MTADELARLLEPTIERLGYELSDLEVKLGGRGGVVRVFIDHPDGISLDDCETVSLAVSALLDVEDPVPGNYNLEVSSPGLDRKLVKPADYERFRGKKATIKLRTPRDGRGQFTGRLAGLSEGGEALLESSEGETAGHDGAGLAHLAGALAESRCRLHQIGQRNLRPASPPRSTGLPLFR